MKTILKRTVPLLFIFGGASKSCFAQIKFSTTKYRYEVINKVELGKSHFYGIIYPDSLMDDGNFFSYSEPNKGATSVFLNGKQVFNSEIGINGITFKNTQIYASTKDMCIMTAVGSVPNLKRNKNGKEDYGYDIQVHEDGTVTTDNVDSEKLYVNGFGAKTLDLFSSNDEKSKMMTITNNDESEIVIYDADWEKIIGWNAKCVKIECSVAPQSPLTNKKGQILFTVLHNSTPDNQGGALILDAALILATPVGTTKPLTIGDVLISGFKNYTPETKGK